MIMTKFESYLKERNIPVDSLEANSIKEGMQWTINEACEWLKEKNKMCMYELEMILGRNFIEDFKKEMEGKHG